MQGENINYYSEKSSRVNILPLYPIKMLLKQYFGDWETMLSSVNLTAAKSSIREVMNRFDDFPWASGTCKHYTTKCFKNYDEVKSFHVQIEIWARIS